MNTQELINKIGRLYTYGSKNFIERKEVIDLVKQLDEPQKPVVKQLVADWYEENKDDFEFNVWDWIAYGNESEKLENKEFSDWLNDGKGNPIQTLVNMHQFGYEVEEEKRYLVKMKNVLDSTKYLVVSEITGKWFFANSGMGNMIKKHTRKELEDAGFGEVFNSPLFEVEE